MVKHFHNRGYPLNQLLLTLNRVTNIPKHGPSQNSAQNQNAQSETDKDLNLYLITTYNPSNPPLQKIMNF